MKLITKIVKTKYSLKAVTSKNANKETIQESNIITDNVATKEAEIYIKELTIDNIKAAVNAIVKAKREYQIDVKSFVSKKVTEGQVVTIFVETSEFVNGKIYNVKTKKAPNKIIHSLFNVTDGKKAFTKAKVFAEAKTYTRDLQIFPPNELNSETYAARIKKDFTKYTNLKLTILNKKQIETNKMGLLLSVNKGSAYEPRVVIIEYKGDLKSKNKTAFIGKGVTFDAGGYNIKTGKYMSSMKYDMSGSATVVGTMMAISKLKPKANVAGVLVLTDNMINSIASTPDSVWTAMNGKTVEINNTDAEGRLAMADGLTYAVKKLNATRLIDAATLTGAVISALGHTYTGTWATTDKAWKDISEAALKADELVWRMPFHKDYFKYMSGSKVADMFNTDLTGRGGASTAAMFLKQFTEGQEYIHLDIAGTADRGGIPHAPMVKTIFEVING